jgi:hypothetical protein
MGRFSLCENQDNFLYANNGNSNHWIIILCVGVHSNRSAIGAKVSALATIAGQEIWQTREVGSQSGYNSQNGFHVAFGLGEATQIDSLIIAWPAGGRDAFVGIPADQFITVTEGGKITSVNHPMRNPPEQFQLLPNYPNPFNPSTTISFLIPVPTRVALKVYNVQGNLIKTLLDQMQNAGVYSVVWNGTNNQEERVASGLYVYRLHAGAFSQAGKMILLE